MLHGVPWDPRQCMHTGKASRRVACDACMGPVPYAARPHALSNAPGMQTSMAGLTVRLVTWSAIGDLEPAQEEHRTSWPRRNRFAERPDMMVVTLSRSSSCSSRARGSSGCWLPCRCC